MILEVTTFRYTHDCNIYEVKFREIAPMIHDVSIMNLTKIDLIHNEQHTMLCTPTGNLAKHYLTEAIKTKY